MVSLYCLKNAEEGVISLPDGGPVVLTGDLHRKGISSKYVWYNKNLMLRNCYLYAINPLH